MHFNGTAIVYYIIREVVALVSAVVCAHRVLCIVAKAYTYASRHVAKTFTVCGREANLLVQVERVQSLFIIE